jgi:hypothetical protein
MKTSYIIKLTPNKDFPEEVNGVTFRKPGPRYLVHPEKLIEKPGFTTEDEAWEAYETMLQQFWRENEGVVDKETSQWGLNWEAHALRVTVEEVGR